MSERQGGQKMHMGERTAKLKPQGCFKSNMHKIRVCCIAEISDYNFCIVSGKLFAKTDL